MNSAMTIVGNVTRTPEIRFTASGVATVSFGVAVNRRVLSKVTGDTTESVSFFNVVAWNSLAENVAQSVNKGDRIMVMGRLEQRSWVTDSGERRTVYEVVADEVGPSLRWAGASVQRTQRVAPEPEGAHVADDGYFATGLGHSGESSRAHLASEAELVGSAPF